jgi:two-component system sensor histidine kinase TctE
MGSGWSIRGRLFGLWLLMLIVVSMIVYWSTNAIVERSLREGQNRNLQAVAQVILDSAIKVDNAIEFELPYQAFEVLAYSAPERIYYAVFLDDEHLSGYQDLPAVDNDELPAYERLYRGESTRFLMTSKPISPGSSERLRSRLVRPKPVIRNNRQRLRFGLRWRCLRPLLYLHCGPN